MTVITVSQVNTYIKALLEESPPLNNIYIVGEISNFVHHYRSGHFYFSLKDERTQIKAVMFSSNAQRLKFNLEDGMRVICRGKISLYERDGYHQLYVDDVQPDGVGTLSIAFEQLKTKLEREGLFSDDHKKLIPRYPAKIGVATSDTGAAIEDIKNITKRRYPLAELVVAPTIVQGEAACEDIVKSINLLDSIDDIDVIIVGRGGGSIEDLWAFNTESVARAVFNCKTPIISAVGHETDFTICDFVSDMRAPTPSAAAELAVPDMNVILSFTNNAERAIAQSLQRKLEQEYQRLDNASKNNLLSNPNEYFELQNDRLEAIENCLEGAMQYVVDCNNQRIVAALDKLNILNPLNTIARGFGVVKKNNQLVKSISSLSKGDKITIDVHGGQAECTVDEVNING